MKAFMRATIIALVCVFAIPAFAQTPTPAPGTKTPAINKRQMNQQKRIKQGVKSGELTPAETKHLEKREAKIQAQKKADKASGTVTPAEKAKLNRELNRTSKAIYRKKHNAKVVK